MVDSYRLPGAHPVAALVLLAFLGGCAGLGEQRESPAGISEPRGETVEGEGQRESGATAATGSAPTPPAPSPEAPRESASQGAHGTLLASAVQARAAGNSERAVALLERALRIDPDNAGLYLELAQTHLDAGNAAQARATAERGLLYCRGQQCADLRGLIERAVSAVTRS